MFTHPREQQFTATTLTMSEAAGSVSASFFERRTCRTPADWPSPITRFLDHGSPRRPIPSPSSRRSAPGTNGAAA